MSTSEKARAGPGHTPRGRPSGRRQLTTLVCERLLDEIWSGRWRLGDKLPTEPEMVALFGISRTPIREAMQSLRLLGVVDISPRRGATIRALPVESVVDLAVLSGLMSPRTSVVDVFEFRDSMESAIAGLAAKRASNDEIEAMRTTLVEHADAIDRRDREQVQSLDVRFHAAVAQASGNTIYKSLALAMNGLFVELRRVTGGIPGASEEALKEHQTILAAIAERDVKPAQSASARHIRLTRSRYERASRPSSSYVDTRIDVTPSGS